MGEEGRRGSPTSLKILPGDTPGRGGRQEPWLPCSMAGFAGALLSRSAASSEALLEVRLTLGLLLVYIHKPLIRKGIHGQRTTYIRRASRDCGGAKARQPQPSGASPAVQSQPIDNQRRSKGRGYLQLPPAQAHPCCEGSREYVLQGGANPLRRPHSRCPRRDGSRWRFITSGSERSGPGCQGGPGRQA